MPYREILSAILRLLLKAVEETASSTRSPVIYKKRKRSRVGEAPARIHQWTAHATEEEHRTDEEFQWRETRNLTIFTLVAGIFAIAVSTWTLVETRRQATAAEKTLKEMQDEQRPWIIITNLTPMSVIINKSQINIKYRIDYKNIGHKPAEKIRTYGGRLIYGGTKQTIQMLDNECIEGIDTVPVMDVLLPDEEGHYFFFMGLFISDIVASQLSVEKIEFARYIAPTITGCISYTSGGSDDLRTGYSFILEHKGSPKTVDGLDASKAFDLTVPMSFDDNDLTATSTPQYKYAH